MRQVPMGPCLDLFYFKDINFRLFDSVDSNVDDALI